MPSPDEILPVAPRRAAWVATVTAVVVVAAFIVGKTARDAILLSHFGIETLPIFITVSAVSSVPVILVAGRLMTRFGPARLMPVLNLGSGLLALLEWSQLSAHPGPVTVVIFIHLSTSGAVLVSGFWSIINERFDVQSAKRHIGRIGMGATLGGIAGGLIAQGTAAVLAPDAILLVLGALQITCAAALYAFGTGGVRQHAVAPRFALGVVTRSKLLRNLAVVVVLGAIAAAVLDYVFKADIVATASKSGLLRALAIYYTVTSVVTAIVQVAFTGPVIARLGVPRSVAMLPLAVTAFGIAALAVPAAFAATLARGAETITRSSIYRAGYELLYAPLPATEKRPAKIVLDVGGERLGDLLGAQVVALIVYTTVAPRVGLLVAATVTGLVALTFAFRLPRNYTRALGETLVARGGEPPVEEVEAGPIASWPVSEPSFGQSGELSPLSLRILDRTLRKPAAAPTRVERDLVTAAIGELRSSDPARVKRALAAELTPELAAMAIGLVGRDDVAREAIAALGRIAPRCTGQIIDALLDPLRDAVVRRRLPEILLAGEPELAVWGLWRGLTDPSFEVRYRCGDVIARLVHAGKVAQVTAETMFEAVRRELVGDPALWRAQRVVDDPLLARDPPDDEPRTGGALEHIFTVLGLVLPAEPLRIALHAVQTDDSKLRETALEYLESILPADVRAQLWPLLEVGAAAPDRVVRSKDELAAELGRSYTKLRATHG